VGIFRPKNVHPLSRSLQITLLRSTIQFHPVKTPPHWDLTDQDNISPNGGMLALPLHRAQETLDVARAEACPASEQLVRIQLN
jgi:hypothetical protein